MKSGIYGTGVLPPFVPLKLNDLGVAPTGVLPPAPTSPVTSTFNGTTVTLAANTGLPTVTTVNALNTIITQGNNPLSLPTGTPDNPSNVGIPNETGATVLYTGVLVGLTGNTMDLVRGQMDDGLDVSVTYNQRDQIGQYRFRAVQRLALRLKDPTAVILFLFLDC